LGCECEEATRIFKANTVSEIIRKLNSEAKVENRVRRNHKRRNVVSLIDAGCKLPQELLPSLLSLVDICTKDPLRRSTSPIKSRECEPKSACFIKLSKDQTKIENEEILTDSDSAASIMSPCKKEDCECDDMRSITCKSGFKTEEKVTKFSEFVSKRQFKIGTLKKRQLSVIEKSPVQSS